MSILSQKWYNSFEYNYIKMKKCGGVKIMPVVIAIAAGAAYMWFSAKSVH